MYFVSSAPHCPRFYTSSKMFHLQTFYNTMADKATVHLHRSQIREVDKLPTLMIENFNLYLKYITVMMTLCTKGSTILFQFFIKHI